MSLQISYCVQINYCTLFKSSTSKDGSQDLSGGKDGMANLLETYSHAETITPDGARKARRWQRRCSSSKQRSGCQATGAQKLQHIFVFDKNNGKLACHKWTASPLQANFMFCDLQIQQPLAVQLALWLSYIWLLCSLAPMYLVLTQFEQPRLSVCF